jgi:hypothetical protein
MAVGIPSHDTQKMTLEVFAVWVTAPFVVQVTKRVVVQITKSARGPDNKVRCGLRLPDTNRSVRPFESKCMCIRIEAYTHSNRCEVDPDREYNVH